MKVLEEEDVNPLEEFWYLDVLVRYEHLRNMRLSKELGFNMQATRECTDSELDRRRRRILNSRHEVWEVVEARMEEKYAKWDRNGSSNS